MEPVSIPKGSAKLAGLLFKPASLSGLTPAAVVVHPSSGVKEQTASIYARKLSERGYTTICYDASHQGESEGSPRFLEDPTLRTTDISAVADYLQGLDYVDASRIFVVGICAGGGYAVAAAKTDHRFKAVAVASAVNFGDAIRHGVAGKDNPSDKTAILDQVAQARQAEAQGAEETTFPLITPLNENSSRDDRDTFEYYKTPRGQHRNSPNKFMLRSLPLLLGFDAWQFADIFLTQPLLMVWGDEADTKGFSEKLFGMLEGKNAGLRKVVMPGGGHVDFYDREAYVNPTVEEMAGFFDAVV